MFVFIWMRFGCRVNAGHRVLFRVSEPGACGMRRPTADRVHNSAKMAVRCGEKGGDQAAAGTGSGGGRESRARGFGWVRGWRRFHLYRSDIDELSPVRRVLFPYYYPVCPMQGRPILVVFSSWTIIFVSFVNWYVNLVQNTYNSLNWDICINLTHYYVAVYD